MKKLENVSLKKREGSKKQIKKMYKCYGKVPEKIHWIN
ncbi:hypothetical protein HNP65_001888 [Thermosipho japonicus]|uniref:Uncharacterized protein n=1 Tax=Thermosipho japonicus TaxID=90323 RepID=A0A841GLZ9_9BACT|nr:hypothetical protein [Thermosipho japonicus]